MIGIVRLFFSDLREWGLATAWFNVRFQVGWAVLPGQNKHVSIDDET